MSQLTRKDYQSANDVHWCPGCGDYVILATLQRVFAELQIPREKTAFISGIGCAARFPYYMSTYGMHSIHGRAPAIATGLKLARPDLSVWVITGDGDSLSIGGNHTLHALRRNVDIKILLFNNRIYGLTKGQYSPTSEEGTIAKSTPMGSVDHPVNPVAFAIGAGATFVARTTDSDPKHLGEMIKRANAHEGTAFVEIYQNCVVFNDNTFADVTAKDKRAARTLVLEDKKPLLYDGGKKGIAFDPQALKPSVIDLEAQPERMQEVLVHDENNPFLAELYARLEGPDFPVPIGVMRAVKRACFHAQVHAQNAEAKAKLGQGDLQKLLLAGDVWEVKAAV